MKGLVVAMGVAAGLAGPWGVAAQVTADASTETAEAFVGRLRAGEYVAAESMLDVAMQEAVDAAGLERLWAQLTAGGGLEGWTLAGVRSAQGYRVVDLLARFGTQAVKLRVAVSGDGKVGGFFVLPPEPPPYEVPAYVDTASLREETLTIGEPSFALGATLTLPVGEGPYAAVVLVHGSGPQDRDETIGANRPFRDLAWGLATRGVAVLRYDKRTFAHGSRMTGAVTVEEEVIADALAALSAARAHSAIEDDRVWLLGHSLGGMLGPEIVARDGRSGLISLAGSPRSLGELIAEQLAYVERLPENATEPARARIAEMRAALARIERREAAPEEIVLGAPASYYYDLAARDVAGRVRDLDAPVLFLQGGRDYQVTARDLELWRGLVGERDDARFVLFEDLNHLFMTGTGMATPAEYVSGSGHVDVRVIEEIARFVRSGDRGR